jgi:hypothetical protein
MRKTEQWLETRFLIPIREDARVGNGAGHPAKRWEGLHVRLDDEFGGWSLDSALVKGVYRDPVTGRTVFDESRRYTVALSRRRLPALRRLLRDVAVEFAQEEIYFVISGTVEFIKRRKGH